MARFKDKFCLTPVSKDVKGDLKVRKQARQKCKKPRCATLKARYRLDLELVSHKPCDKVPKLDGRFRANLAMATQNDGHGRGLHRGRFRWASAFGNVQGRMRGITNAGTHRPPVGDCEPCNISGHMEGQLVGRIVSGRYKGCYIRASYVINYDPGTQAQDTGVWGTIEGVLICRCK